MNKKEFLNNLEEILEIEQNSLHEDMELAELPSWDSLAFLSVIAMADDEFDIVIEGHLLEKVEKVSDLTRLVIDHLDDR
jgi:acyl carrier protein